MGLLLLSAWSLLHAGLISKHLPLVLVHNLGFQMALKGSVTVPLMLLFRDALEREMEREAERESALATVTPDGTLAFENASESDSPTFAERANKRCLP